MTVLRGMGVSPGVGLGPAHLMAGEVPEPEPGSRHGGDAAAERARAARALAQVAAELAARGAEAGGEAGEVLAAQAMMAQDPALAARVEDLIDAGVAAPRAVHGAFGRFRDALRRAGGYLAERAADLDDLRDRAIARLTGLPLRDLPEAAGGPYVLVARDLAPADTALLTRETVAAIVTEQGGPTSHTAILARVLGVPAVVACPGALSLKPGTPVLVDGTAGTVVPEPSEREAARARRPAVRPRTPEEATGPGETADGHRIPLLANIGSPDDVARARAAGAEGVGLLRTEFLFLDRGAAPTVAEQAAVYRRILAAFPGAPVTVRTLDAGADKPVAFLPSDVPERNPALGVRGLRLLQWRPRALREQLAALARAAAQTTAELRVMAPMVAVPEEAAWFAAMCREAGLPRPGVMIEVPAAALRARDLAREAAFFSVGTNDLAQYAFAADRQAGRLAYLNDPWHPALLDLVALAADAGVPCGVCGEAAADPALACVLAGLGVTSLSMSAPAIPAVRAALRRHTLAQCRAAAARARAATSPVAAREAARTELPGLLA